VLGPLELRTSRVTGGPLAAVRLGPPKQRAVLALLAMHADRVVPTDLIIDARGATLPRPTRWEACRSTSPTCGGCSTRCEPAARPRSWSVPPTATA